MPIIEAAEQGSAMPRSDSGSPVAIRENTVPELQYIWRILTDILTELLYLLVTLYSKIYYTHEYNN